MAVGDLYINRRGTSIAFSTDADIKLGDTAGGDAVIRWSDGDSSNEALVIGVGDTSQAVHLTDKAAVATDWNVGADTHPTLYVQ